MGNGKRQSGYILRDKWIKVGCALGELIEAEIPEEERKCKVVEYTLQNEEWD